MLHTSDWMGAHITPSRTYTRRSALKTGGVGLAAVYWPAEAVARTGRRIQRLKGPKVPAHLLRNSYHPLVGQHFNIDGTRLRLQLIAVEALPHAPKGSENGFNLTFRGSRGAKVLHQSVPQLWHRRLGHFKLLITPGQATSQGQHYGAVVNRLHG
jgi:uncharacterized protein DUF6916